MRSEIRIVALSGKHLVGRTLAESVFQTTILPALEGCRPDDRLVLSFAGVELATGSFLKATWLKIHQTQPRGPRCLVTDLCEEVRSEFDIFLHGNRLPGLEATDWTDDGVSVARLHGRIEDAAYAALRLLTEMRGATAPELYRASDQRLTPTAWTNRLNELWRLGLAYREPAGRASRFYPAANEVLRG